jgi:hypothetical protein
MAELKPLGSEKLNGDDKLKRILELTYYKNANNKPQTKSTELVSEAKNGGGVYGIVKEKDGYYVKRGLNESSLDYIGGMFMKNKNRFSSYAEALKRLELVKGQEELQEATKYVLKQNKPQEEVPAAEPSMDVPAPAAEPSADMPAPDMGSGDTEAPSMDDASADTEAPDMGSSDTEAPSMDDTSDEASAEGKPSDYMAEVQKFAGKLGQELRDQKEKMESDDIKYVLNMIISAVDLDKLEEEDIEEISKKFERDEDFGDDEETPAEEPEMGDDEEVPAEEPTSDEDIDEELSMAGLTGEDEPMDALESFINTPVETGEIDLSKYADIDEDDTKEIDMDEIKNEINKSVGETLSKYFN